MAGPIAYYEVEWRELSSDEEWGYMRLDRSATTALITGIDRNKTYVVRARSVGPSGLKSIWVDISHTIAGNVVPEVPANVTASPVADGVLLKWVFSRPLTADIDVLIERGTSASGPFIEVAMVRALQTIITERVNGVFYYRLRTKNYRGETSEYSSVVSGDPETLAELNANINEALQQAINAAAIADGNINTYWQTLPPPAPNDTGDIWFDIDDVSLSNPKVYRWRDNAWVHSPNDALAQALIMANNAQTTADGKVKMFVGPVAPTSGMQPSDLWFDTIRKVLFRWDGFTWNNRISDVTLDQLGGNGINLIPDEYSTFQNETLPPLPVHNGVIIRDPGFRRVDGSSSIMLSTTAAGESYVYLGGSPNIPHTLGKRYLVSAYIISSIAPQNVECFLLLSNGEHVVLGAKPTQSSGVMNVSRLTWVADLSSKAATAFRVRFDNEGGAGNSIWIDGVMVEEQIGTMTTPSAYSRGTSSQRSLSALITAINAQATADGKVDIYRQTTPPPIGGTGAKVGDYWQDTDDGNKWYVCTGFSWIDSTDSRLPQTIVDLQTTNGIVATKTRLFYQEGQPVATANGDLWYQPSSKITRYWNGSGWSLLADYTPASADMLVLNPNFESGSAHWNLQAQFYVEASTNAAISGTGLVRAGGGPSSSAYNSNIFPVTPFSKLYISAAVRNLGGGANGQVYVGFYFYNAAGGFVQAKWATYADNSKTSAGTEWRTVAKKITVPSGAATAMVITTVNSHTSGYWCFDNFRAAYVDDVTEAPVNGTNLVPNSNFSSNEGEWSLGVGPRSIGDYITDGWKVATVSSYPIYCGLESASYDASLRQLFIGDWGGALPNSYSSFHVISSTNFSVNPGDVYVIDCRYQVDIGNARPANVNYYTYMGLWCRNKDGAVISYIGFNDTNQVGGRIGQLAVTIPTGTATVTPLVGVDIVNSGGAITAPWAMCHARFQQFTIRRQSTLDESVVVDGAGWVKPRIEDFVIHGGIRRAGLLIKGSRFVLGGARNIRAAQVAGISTVRTTGALSATSDGVVSVNAHSIELGGETVTYNAVASAVVGLTQTVTYIIVTLDPYLDGGTRTYYAQTSELSAQQIGEGAIVMGLITIPTSGSSGGGGGGYIPPGDECVDAEMILPCGRKARDIVAGDWIQCWDNRSENPRWKWVQVDSNEIHSNVPSTAIISESGAEVWASDTTPMPVRGAGLADLMLIPDMLGQEVVVKDLQNYTCRWEIVTSCKSVGPRDVCHLRIKDQCYFAGLNPVLTIATHNPYYKP